MMACCAGVPLTGVRIEFLRNAHSMPNHKSLNNYFGGPSKRPHPIGIHGYTSVLVSNFRDDICANTLFGFQPSVWSQRTCISRPPQAAGATVNHMHRHEMFPAGNLLTYRGSKELFPKRFKECDGMKRKAYPKMFQMPRLVKVWISAVYWLIFLSGRNALERLGLLRRSRCVVLLYHGVQREERDQFESQMRLMLRLARPINLESVESLAHKPAIRSGAASPPTGLFVAVTFDDGFASVAENAVAVLALLDIPATVFMPVASMGKTPGWFAGPDADKKIMSEEQVRALPGGLVSIGSHSVTHPHMPAVDGDMVIWEMTHSREALEAITGRPVRFFSYPFGEWSSREEKAAREAGYDMTFTIEPVPWLPGQPSTMGRVCVEPGDGPVEFRLKLLGAYCWMPWASSIKRKVRHSIRHLLGRKDSVPHCGGGVETHARD